MHYIVIYNNYVGLKPKVCSDGEIPRPGIKIVIDAGAGSTYGCFRILPGVFGNNKYILTVGAQPQVGEMRDLPDTISDTDIIHLQEGSALHVIIGIVLRRIKMALIDIRACIRDEIQRIQDV